MSDLLEKLARRLGGAKWREAAEVDRKANAELNARLNAGETVTIQTITGLYKDHREACADELETRLREVHLDELLAINGKEGWMDSTDFQWELGRALGGNKIYPDREDCEKEHPCITVPDMHEPCTAQRVIVIDADAWDAAKKAFEESLG